MENNVHILIVEDSPTQAVELEYLLNKNNYQVTVAKDGKKALEMLQQITPTIIISDIVMPEMNGYELCAAVKKNDHLKNIPVILLTSLSNPEDVINGLSCGANNFIVKPYNEHFLLSQIRYILANLEIRKTASTQMSIEIMFRDKKYFLNSERVQMIDLLLSTYEVAIQRNQDFQITNEKLLKAKDELEDRVQERTAELSATNVELQKEIKKRKQAEQVINESEERYRIIFEGTAEGILLADTETRRFRYCNPAICEMLGYTKEELTGLDVTDIHPKESLNHVLSVFKDQACGDRLLAPSLPCLRKDGRVIFADVQTTSAVIDGRQCNVGFFNDVTNRRHLEAQLRQAQKMEAIGTLAGGVAHDFNNILTTIIGYADLMLMDIGTDRPFVKEIKEIKIAGERAAALTRQLLAFSRKQIVQPKILDLNKLLTGIEKMLVRLIGEDIEILIIPESALCKVEIDPGQMEQVIMNLVVNAKDAMPMGGKLTIETVNMDLDKNYFTDHGIVQKQPGTYVMMTVSDTGIGMGKGIQEHIFDPFYTTKEKGKGTGLGLSTIYGIVKQNNGFIWVYSEPGQGSIFKIYLPKVKRDVKEEEKEQTTVETVSGSEIILIVEDDHSLRKLAQKSLLPHGYRVLVAENGKDALRICEEHEGTIDLMITDVVMPKMGGKETAERLKTLHPQMKVIYMSGYTNDAIVRHGILTPGLNFLQKPFSPKDLAHKVREVLDKNQN